MTADLLAWLDAVDARAAAATPGPWREGRWDDSACMSVYGVTADTGQVILYDCNCHVASESALDDRDAEFIAAAREDVPRMSAALRAIAALCEHGISRPTAGADFREFVDTIQVVLGRLDGPG